jgi:signal transduction histidine kinase/ActR/RegA family two-component response regulator
MIELLLGIPPRAWALLALVLLVPIGLALAVRRTSPGRRLGLATRLTSRAMAMMGGGFTAMALVATLAVLETGLEEVRRRHLPAVVDLATEIGRGHARAPDSVSIPRTLSLFRALQPEVGPVAAWGLACGTRCLAVAADPGEQASARGWAERTIARPPAAGALRTVTIERELYLVIPAVLRDAAGTPEGGMAVAVQAGWVADRAIRTALTLLALAYLMLFAVGWLTRGMLAATVASRVRDIALRLRAPAAAGAGVAPPPGADELAVLEHAVVHHVKDSIERLHDADRQTQEARALAARMEATATLAAGVAHDFSNLMSGVMANCEVLRGDVAQDPAAARTLETIMECASRGGELAEQLVAFSRGGKYRPIVVNLNALIEETLRLERHSLGPDIRVTSDLAWDLLRVDGDPTQLSQVFANLHRNAVEALRHGPPGGTITVRTWNVPADARPRALAEMPAGPYVALSVADSGPGMSEETRARIFEPFFTTKEGGRGMGLAAAYGIVTHHGGQFEVESHPGSGTTFTVYLPATSAPAVSRQARPPAGSVASDGTTVLVVDDEVPILSATQRLLERRGYRVLTAASGADALHVAQNVDGAIDVVVLDLRMPGMSGAEAFDPLRAAHPDARVIVSSADELDDEARRLLERGAADFVRKPFRVEELNAAIERAMGRTRAARE